MDTFNATKGATILIVDDSRFQRKGIVKGTF